MQIEDFYKQIDRQLEDILKEYKNDPIVVKYKRDIANQKSYALLIWFLDFYGRKSNYTDYITDGHNDSSCDIVFDNTDSFGVKTFYVVQSKWNTIKNAHGETDKDEILKALSDFDTIVRGEKRNVNNKLKVKLEELDQHLKLNGTVKFIFLSLSAYKGGADENLKAFTKNDDKTKFEIIDINRIRHDFIDRTYKQIEPLNPLENYENPEESPISLDIVQKNGNFLKIERPFEAYMLLLKPKTIYDLFEKYGFALFYKNVRNPLLKSNFNKDIKETALENPAFFWYYNNGITAITYILPSIGKQAETISLTGLQIINGAQTVYSVYEAYKNASPIKRRQMDNEALITLRLLKSGGKDFDLNVTRFTNSQNPIQDRDFCANDDVQVRLQEESYHTEVWYEKRRDEFRVIPSDIRKVPNFQFANLYLAYYLQDPISVLKNHSSSDVNKDLNFLSHRDHKDGQYERIFNKNTRFEEMLCAFYIFDVLQKVSSPLLPYNETFKTDIYHLIALFKAIFTKYLITKFGDNSINVSKYVIKTYKKGNIRIIVQTIYYIRNFIDKQLSKFDTEQKKKDFFEKFLLTSSSYDKIKADLDEIEISVREIESIDTKGVENRVTTPN